MGALGTETCMICQNSLTPTFTFFGRATDTFSFLIACLEALLANHRCIVAGLGGSVRRKGM